MNFMNELMDVGRQSRSQAGAGLTDRGASEVSGGGAFRRTLHDLFQSRDGGRAPIVDQRVDQRVDQQPSRRNESLGQKEKQEVSSAANSSSSKPAEEEHEVTKESDKGNASDLKNEESNTSEKTEALAHEQSEEGLEAQSDQMQLLLELAGGQGTGGQGAGGPGTGGQGTGVMGEKQLEAAGKQVLTGQLKEGHGKTQLQNSGGAMEIKPEQSPLIGKDSQTDGQNSQNSQNNQNTMESGLQADSLNQTADGSQKMAEFPTKQLDESTPGALKIDDRLKSLEGASENGGIETKADVNQARLSRVMNNAVQQKGGVVTMRLSPHEMGAVRVQMEIVEGVIKAELSTEKEAARDMLRLQMNDLKQSLESQGFKVEKLEVNTIGQSQETASDSGREMKDDKSKAFDRQSRHDSASGQSRGRRDQSSGQQTGNENGQSFQKLEEELTQSGTEFAQEITQTQLN